MSDDFQEAAKRAQARVGHLVWVTFSLHEQAEAIYKEWRAMDAERLAEAAKKSPP